MLSHPPELDRPEPRWPAMIAALSAVALHYALPGTLRVGPPWALGAIIIALILAAHVARWKGNHKANNIIAFAILGVLTAGLGFGVFRLIEGVVHHSAEAYDLLRAASVLWATNVIVFATWYWRLDGGGPNQREMHDVHMRGAFLFPQMTFESPASADMTIAEEQQWRPRFVDYLFVAFNTSTAFSPTDAPVLTPWAKVAMMVQATISFTTVVLIAARAVNIL